MLAGGASSSLLLSVSDPKSAAIRAIGFQARLFNNREVLETGGGTFQNDGLKRVLGVPLLKNINVFVV